MSETVIIYRNRKSDIVFKEVKLILFQKILQLVIEYGVTKKIFMSADGIIVQFADKTEVLYELKHGSGSAEQPTIFFKLK